MGESDLVLRVRTLAEGVVAQLEPLLGHSLSLDDVVFHQSDDSLKDSSEFLDQLKQLRKDTYDWRD